MLGNRHWFDQLSLGKLIRAAAHIGVTATLVSGCTVGPDFEPVPAPVLDSWQKSNVLRIDRSTGLTSRSEPATYWWKVLDDPTLDKLVRMAYSQNLTLRTAGIRIYEARAQLGIIIGDGYPQTQQVAAGFKQERVADNVGVLRDISRVVDFDPSFRRWDVGFDAGWELDIWGKFRRGVEAADANLIAEIANYDDVLVTLTGEVAKAYVTIRELQEELAITRRNVSLQSQSLGITRLRQSGNSTFGLGELFLQCLALSCRLGDGRIKSVDQVLAGYLPCRYRRGLLHLFRLNDQVGGCAGAQGRRGHDRDASPPVASRVRHQSPKLNRELMAPPGGTPHSTTNLLPSSARATSSQTTPSTTLACTSTLRV